MPSSLEFILGLLERDHPAAAAWEDFLGEHGEALGLWQDLGFLATEPDRHPVPSCPHCLEGVPSLLDGRYLCNVCFSTVDPRHLQLWRFDLAAFLRWLARSLMLAGTVRQIDERLWQLGTLTDGDRLLECFFARSGSLSAAGHARLLAYRRALILRPAASGIPPEGFLGPWLSLVEVCRLDGHGLTVTALPQLLHGSNVVRFDGDSGGLWVGDAWAGEVPVGSREHAFLATLALHQDRVVSYADIKHAVLERCGCRDTTEEATFCQNLKSRIKKKYVPKLDLLLAATGRGDGYRLRGQVIGGL